MYIERLHIQHLKLLRDFTLDFRNPDGSPRMWTVIIGPNGTAKTSILQAIALAAAGSLQVNRLAESVVAHLVDRRHEEAMQVGVVFRFSDKGSFSTLHQTLDRALRPTERLTSSVRLEKGQLTLMARSNYIDEHDEIVARASERDPLDDARAKNLPHWFVTGYGISRFLPEPQRRARLNQPAIERLEPLFGSVELTSLGFLDIFPDELSRKFVKVFRDALTRVETLVPGLRGVDLGGRHGVTKAGTLIDRDRFYLKIGEDEHKLPAVALSHGYQSTLAWLADLVGHVMWEAGCPIDASEIEGLVLIDEIDLYLHPGWQAGLITALRETFPKVQFIVTTHSPVVLSSLEAHEIVAVDQHPQTGDVERFVHDADSGAFVAESLAEAVAREPDPRTMSGADLYRLWFGIDRLTPFPHGQLLREYLMLATDPLRTDEEEQELLELQQRLDAHKVRHRPPVERQPR